MYTNFNWLFYLYKNINMVFYFIQQLKYVMSIFIFLKKKLLKNIKKTYILILLIYKKGFFLNIPNIYISSEN